jgi:D-3-phosphoglycerate dehydrogenase
MKVLISGAGRDQTAFSAIQEAGHELISPPVMGERAARLSDEELSALAADADLSLMPLPRTVMARAPKLRAIIQASIGVERIDVPSATEHGILVCNSPSPANFNGVAEATVGLLVSLSKRLKRKEASIRNTGWGTESDRGVLLMGRTLGIVGFGRIGSGVARRLQNWGIRIIACDPHVQPEKATSLDVELVDLDTLLQEADFVTLHLVVTPETTKMIGERELRLMKPTAYLVNTSRGQVIDEDALCRALDEEWIAGAALDVFDPEPLSRESPLRDLDQERVILTPHSASHTWESRQGNVEYAIASTLAILRGEIPDTVVNPEAIPLWEKRFEAVREAAKG